MDYAGRGEERRAADGQAVSVADGVALMTPVDEAKRDREGERSREKRDQEEGEGSDRERREIRRGEGEGWVGSDPEGGGGEIGSEEGGV